MTKRNSLKLIYEKRVRGDPKIQKNYNYKMQRIAEVVKRGICQHSPVLGPFYHQAYPHTTGSHWDKLTVGHSRQECDINVVFNFNKFGMPVDLKFKSEDRHNRPNFSYVCVDYCRDKDGSELSQILVRDTQLGTIVSPIKLFREFVEAAKRFFGSKNGFLWVKIPSEGTFRFKTRTKIGAPLTVFFSHENFAEIEIDFVPAILIPRNKVRYRRFHKQISIIESRYGDCREDCLAICLHKAEPDRFQIDFHEMEKKILAEKNFIKMIIRLLKYLRNVWLEPLSVLSSHVIKSVVMQKILSRDKNYWKNNWNLEDNFRECFTELVSSVRRGCVKDVLWGVNILPVKVKHQRTWRYLADALDSLARVLDKGGIDALFKENHKTPRQSCLKCDPYSDLGQGINNHWLLVHKWSKHTAYKAATSSEENERRRILEELRQLPLMYRESDYSKKRVLCPHCLKIVKSKRKLLYHIFFVHAKCRAAAGMALWGTKKKF